MLTFVERIYDFYVFSWKANECQTLQLEYNG